VAQMVSTSVCPPSYRARANASRLGLVSFFGRPPSGPRGRAGANTACVRSRMGSRSNPTSAPKTWKMSVPPELVVPIRLVRNLKPTPRSASAATTSIRRRSERPSRSNRRAARQRGCRTSVSWRAPRPGRVAQPSRRSPSWRPPSRHLYSRVPATGQVRSRSDGVDSRRRSGHARRTTGASEVSLETRD
jgi:hypothetical protein